MHLYGVPETTVAMKRILIIICATTISSASISAQEKERALEITVGYPSLLFSAEFPWCRLVMRIMIPNMTSTPSLYLTTETPVCMARYHAHSDINGSSVKASACIRPSEPDCQYLYLFRRRTSPRSASNSAKERFMASLKQTFQRRRHSEWQE